MSRRNISGGDDHEDESRRSSLDHHKTLMFLREIVNPGTGVERIVILVSGLMVTPEARGLVRRGRHPMCTCVNEEWSNGEGVSSEASYLCQSRGFGQSLPVWVPRTDAPVYMCE